MLRNKFKGRVTVFAKLTIPGRDLSFELGVSNVRYHCLFPVP